MTSMTFEEQVKKLEDILQKFKDVIPSNGSKHKGEELHAFGPYNLQLEQENVNEIIGNLKNKYEKFCSISNPSNVMKLISEKQALSNLARPMKSFLREATAKMREVAKDTTLKTTVQKLEVISLEEGLRFDCGQTSSNYFISSDLFYIEVMLDSCGLAEDVKFQGHTGEAKSCKELVHVLRMKDYKEFRCHLQGLKERYVLKGNPFQKPAIVSALELLEDDVVKIMKSDMSCNTVSDCIMRGPIGYVIPRAGGKALQMTYCTDPLLLLDVRNEGMVKVYSSDDPLPRNIGYSAMLSVRQSENTLLPRTSLVSLENNILRYSKQDASNSEELPATFVLKLTKPLPASTHTAKCIHKLLNKGYSFVHSSSASLDDLIIQQHIGKDRLEWEDEEFSTTLPDEIHLFRCLPCEDNQNVGVLLSNIPFTNPLQIPHIIKILRCQAVYNILLCSCLNSSNENKDASDTKKLVFDVTASDWNTITVTFVHPLNDSIASTDFIVTSESFVECMLNVTPGSPVFCSNSYLNKVVNRCLSIPITTRSLFRKSGSYKPEHDVSINSTAQQKATHRRPMKLLMPSLAQIQSGINLMSPQLTSSPSSFLNFSACISPGTSLFPDSSRKGARKRTTSVGTPGSDGSKTPKLKLTLKRKRNEDSEIYEIDQTKSDFEDLPTEPSSADSLSFVYSQFEGDGSLHSSQSIFPDSFPDLPLEGETDIEGLLGLTSEPFIQGDPLAGGYVGSQVPAFDLDAITSGNDVTLQSVPGGVIDPSVLVSGAAAFDIDAGVIDIDSLMNVVSSDQL